MGSMLLQESPANGESRHGSRQGSRVGSRQVSRGNSPPKLDKAAKKIAAAAAIFNKLGQEPGNVLPDPNTSPGRRFYNALVNVMTPKKDGPWSLKAKLLGGGGLLIGETYNVLHKKTVPAYLATPTPQPKPVLTTEQLANRGNPNKQFNREIHNPHYSAPNVYTKDDSKDK
jgi:hypothetical protein